MADVQLGFRCIYLQRPPQVEVGAEKKTITRQYNDLLWLHRVVSKNLDAGGNIVSGVRDFVPRRDVGFL